MARAQYWGRWLEEAWRGSDSEGKYGGGYGPVPPLYMGAGREAVERSGAFKRHGHTDRGHAGCSGGGNAHLSVFKDQAIFWFDAEALSGDEEAIGGGLATRIVFSADEDVELAEEAERSERVDDGASAASGDDRQRDVAVFGFDMLYHFGDGLEVVDEFEIEGLFTFCEGIDRHAEAMH